MKKIFFIATVAGFFDFFEGQFRELSSYADLTLVANDQEKLKQIADRENTRYRYINIKRGISPLYDIITLFNLFVLFCKEKPNIVHGNTPKGGLLSMLAAMLALVPVRIYMCHGLRYQSHKGIMRQLLMLMDKIACFCSTEVICVSMGVKETLEDDLNCSKDKLIVIGDGSCNGVDVKYFDSDKIKTVQINNIYLELGIPKDGFIYTYVGRIVRDKGLFELVDAFIDIHTKNSNSFLMIIGSIGDYDSCYKELKLRIPIESNIFFLGYKTDIRPYLAVASVLVLPSYREGFGMVLAEAASMRVPVIATNIIGCTDVVIENVNGVFCTPKDSSSLSKAMAELMYNTSRYQKIKKITRNSIIKRYERNKVMLTYVDYYKQLLCTKD